MNRGSEIGAINDIIRMHNLNGGNMRITTLTGNLICGLVLLACDPSEAEFDLDSQHLDSESTDELEELLDEPDVRFGVESSEDEGEVDPCNEELGIEASTEEQPVGLCWVNGKLGTTSTETIEDKYTTKCCGVGSAWKQKTKHVVKTCCANGDCMVLEDTWKTYCTAEFCGL
jgi:hypothetical protein